MAWDRTSPAFIPLALFEYAGELDADGKPPYVKLTRIDKDEVLIGQPVAAERGDKDDTKTAGWWVLASLPSLGTLCYRIEPLTDSVPESDMQFKENSISNGPIKIELDPTTGAFLGLYSRDVNEDQNLFQGDYSNLTVGFLDDYKNDHAWNIKPEYWKYPLDIPNDKDVQIRVVDSGPVFISLEISRTFGDR